MPVTKTPLPSRHVLYDSKECSHHTIYSGTTIIQTRYALCMIITAGIKNSSPTFWLCIPVRRSYTDRPVLARVVRTGFHTNKGSLVAAILYPPPADFKFDQDSYKFIGILALIASCGFIYTIVTKVKFQPRYCTTIKRMILFNHASIVLVAFLCVSFNYYTYTLLLFHRRFPGASQLAI